MTSDTVEIQPIGDGPLSDTFLVEAPEGFDAQELIDAYIAMIACCFGIPASVIDDSSTGVTTDGIPVVQRASRTIMLQLAMLEYERGRLR